ncbi:cupin domain-containing protein [Pseudohaliea sp.]|uniref:cupin domain-containing protein n=1 Tax=Pseudohaliea sp. TaxID=2740289 RepID=UPI0032EB78FE
MSEAKLLQDPLTLSREEMTDWGDVAVPIGEPVSHECGVLLFRREDRSSEMGLWECTPGTWRCDVEKDEFCYFLSGEAVYRPDDGSEFVVREGIAAAFPAGWKGTCEVKQTVRKVYMVR